MTTEIRACFTDDLPVMIMMMMMMMMQVMTHLSACFTDVCSELAVLLRQTAAVLPVAVIGGVLIIRTSHLSAVKTVKTT